jgi:hypothetical protein
MCLENPDLHCEFWYEKGTRLDKSPLLNPTTCIPVLQITLRKGFKLREAATTFDPVVVESKPFE